MFVPAKMIPDKTARGFKPKAGWYPFDNATFQADLTTRFASKRTCQQMCDLMNTPKPSSANRYVLAPMAPTSGTGLIGATRPLNRVQIERLLGPGQDLDPLDTDFKIHVEWIVREAETGDVLTVHDYKQGRVGPNTPISWSVGGMNRKIGLAFVDWLNANAR